MNIGGYIPVQDLKAFNVLVLITLCTRGNVLAFTKSKPARPKCIFIIAGERTVVAGKLMSVLLQFFHSWCMRPIFQVALRGFICILSLNVFGA